MFQLNKISLETYNHFFCAFPNFYYTIWSDSGVSFKDKFSARTNRRYILKVVPYIHVKNLFRNNQTHQNWRMFAYLEIEIFFY